MNKRDFFKECNTVNAPVDDFNLAFCSRCYQPECTRSLHGKTKFDVRTSTWLDRLFVNPPRMDSTDPRFESFRAQSFFMIQPPAPGQMGSWGDPRDLVSIQVPVTVKAPTPPQLPQQEAKPVIEPLPPRFTGQNIPKDVVLINTPRQEGVMLRGAPPATPKPPPRDPWSGPTPLSPGETLVKRGATVRFGGGVQGEPAPTKIDQGESK